jgi:hypothetical protein
MDGTPKGVWVPVAFFVGGGLLEIALAIYEMPRPWQFWPLWEALGRAMMHFLLAFGLWQRVAVCRSIAMVYCLAVVPTYGAALALAYAGAPFRFPPSVVLQSLYQVPSCLLLFPYLRSEHAAELFTRPLLGRQTP